MAIPLFQRDEILKAVLTAPISQAYAQKGQNARIYLPGQWSYIDEDGATAKLDVSIRTRGNFRRMYCELAPLQLNFKKSQVKGTLFAGQNKVKLVAPCVDTPSFRRYVLLEYLAYRILEVLTDHSYRTRLIRLSYVDSDEILQPWTAVTFVIEDDDEDVATVATQSLRKHHGEDSLEVDYIIVQSPFQDIEPDVVQRLRERAEPERLVELLSKLHEESEDYWRKVISDSLLARDPCR